RAVDAPTDPAAQGVSQVRQTRWVLDCARSPGVGFPRSGMKSPLALWNSRLLRRALQHGCQDVRNGGSKGNRLQHSYFSLTFLPLPSLPAAHPLALLPPFPS
ncbi:unnamed protein product, partial [Bubo scandiacus]